MNTAETVETIDITALYTAHRMPLIRLAVLLVDDTATAEDVVQDAFVGLTRQHHRVRDPQAALAYLRVSVVNGSRTVLRKRRTVRGFLARTSPDPVDLTVDAALIIDEDHREVLAALRTLPRRMREVLVLRYWSDLTEAQIAAALGVTEGTVKSTSSRAMDRLELALGGAR